METEFRMGAFDGEIRSTNSRRVDFNRDVKAGWISTRFSEGWDARIVDNGKTLDEFGQDLEVVYLDVAKLGTFRGLLDRERLLRRTVYGLTAALTLVVSVSVLSHFSDLRNGSRAKLDALLDASTRVSETGVVDSGFRDLVFALTPATEDDR